MPKETNGLEVGRGQSYLRVSGRDFLVILLLGAALGYIVWNVAKQHERIIDAIKGSCGPAVQQIF